LESTDFEGTVRAQDAKLTVRGIEALKPRKTGSWEHG
jgi:hypothetical protein